MQSSSQTVRTCDQKQGQSANRSRTLLILVALSLLVPQSVFADAGTPLMWAGLAHLVIGNFIVGLFEGLILAKLFSLKYSPVASIMVGANYFSAWCGYWLLNHAVIGRLHMDLNNGWTWFWILVFMTYLATLVIEWPFVAMCLRGKPDWFRKSIRGNLLVQTLSYVLLFGWYWMASGTSLYTKMRIVSPDELSLPESVAVYFISAQDGNVYARSLAGRQNDQVFVLQSTNENDRLAIRPSSGRTNSWDLMACMEVEGSVDPKLVEIAKSFAAQAVADWSANQDTKRFLTTWNNFGPVPRLASADSSTWEFETGFWPIEGIRGTNRKDQTHLHICFETPFGAWNIRNATQLPGNLVLFQLGEDQICVLDPGTKRVALLTHGRGPVAVISEGKNK